MRRIRRVAPPSSRRMKVREPRVWSQAEGRQKCLVQKCQGKTGPQEGKILEKMCVEC